VEGDEMGGTCIYYGVEKCIQNVCGNQSMEEVTLNLKCRQEDIRGFYRSRM